MALKLQSKHSITAQAPNMIAQSRQRAFFSFPEKNARIDSINSSTKTGFALRLNKTEKNAVKNK